jgi:type IV pilus assembly protein PilE
MSERCAAATRPPMVRAGFTLVELLIVMAVIGILAAIALPSYAEHLRRSHRAEARAGLMQAAHWLERAATARGSYPLAPEFMPALSRVPSGRYRIALQSEDGVGYVLSAVPQGGQSGDRCGSFTLTQAGEQGLVGASAGMAECWAR